jgi:hypothetical protein
MLLLLCRLVFFRRLSFMMRFFLVLLSSWFIEVIR